MTAFFFTTIPLQNEWNLLPPQLQSKAEEGRKASQLSEVGISQRVACSGARQAGRPRRAAAWRTQPTMSAAAVQPEPRPHPVPTLPEGFPIVPGEAWGKMLGLVVHTWDSSTKEAEAGEWKVVNQHRLHQDGLKDFKDGHQQNNLVWWSSVGTSSQLLVRSPSSSATQLSLGLSIKSQKELRALQKTQHPHTVHNWL